MSFTFRGDKYLGGAAETMEHLPPGLYTIDEHMFIGPFMAATTFGPEELIDLHGTPADDVMEDVKQFLAKRQDFERFGFAHRRGYLLYGPPGTGKSSVSKMIAKRFVELGGVVVVGSGAYDLPNAVNFMQANDPGRDLMVMLEDPDEDDMNESSVLGCLDGTRVVSGLVTVLTTNYKSKLPPRLANRPGRFDRVVRIDRIPRAIQVEFLRRLQARDSNCPDVAEALVKALDGIPLTLAHMKEAFVAHVLLGASLSQVRERFLAMAHTGDAEDDDNEVKAELWDS